jgi:hypothetical protein
MVAGPVDEHPKPLTHVRGLQQLTLLHLGQVRRVARRVRQRRRVGQLVDEVDDLPGLAALQHREQQLLVFGGQRADLVGRLGFFRFCHLDPQRGAGAVGARTDVRTLGSAHHRRGPVAARYPADLHDRGEHAVRGVAVLQPRSNQQLTAFAGLSSVDSGTGGIVQLDRHHHSRQHDRVTQEQHRHRLGFSHQSSKV